MSWRDKFRPRRRGGDGFNNNDRDVLVCILEGIVEMTDIVSRLKDDVAQQTTVINSVVTLLSGLAQRVRDANDNDDTDELNSIADELEHNSTTLAQAVEANTASEAQPEQQGSADQGDTTDATLGTAQGTTSDSTSQQGSDQPTAQPQTNDGSSDGSSGE